MAQRLLIVGWDAADWMIIDPLFERGRMPRLKQLVEAGVRADLSTLEPKLSPLLWTSIATGKTADKHGILNFVEPKPEGDGLRVSQSTTRKTKAIWNILSQTGFTTNAVGWYASHPAEQIRGHVVSNLLQEGEPKIADAAWPLLEGVVHPASLAGTVAAGRQRVRTYPHDNLRKLLPKIDEIGRGDDLGVKLEKLMAYATSVEAAAHVAMAAGDWDVTMVFFDAIDTVGHHFMQYRPPRMTHVSERESRIYGEVMDRVYEWHDQALGRLLDRAGSDTTVLLLSDHGFHSDGKRPNLKGLPPERRQELESSWHRPYGVLVAAGPGVVAGATCGPCSVLDLTPTALALLGIAVGEDMDGRALQEILDPSIQLAYVPTWDAVDGEAGLHSPDLRQDPFETTASIRQLVDLGYLAALPNDTQAQLDLVNRESRFNLAVAFMSRQRYEEAIPLFAGLTAEQPATARYALSLVQCQNAHGALTDAIATARSFLAREPGSQECRMLLALALASAGDIAASVKETEVLERTAAHRPELANGLATVAMAQKRFDVAARYAAVASAADPHDITGHLAHARAELALGRFEEAAGHALDALEINQAIPEAHYLLGVALAWYGDLSSALQSLELAAQYDPGSLASHRFAALVAMLARDHNSATRHGSRTRELSAATAQAPPALPFGPADFAAKNGLRES